jgi:hypothetical protein
MKLTVKYQQMLLELNKFYDVLVACPEKNEIVLQRTLKFTSVLSWFRNYKNEKAMEIVSSYTISSYVKLDMVEQNGRRETIYIIWD